MNDYLLVFFLSVLCGISIGHDWKVVVLLTLCVIVFKFIVDIVELYLDEPDA